MKNHSSFSLVASFSKVILRPGHSTALALSTCSQRRHRELVAVEELRIRPEAHRGAGVALADGADHFELRGDFAVLEADVVFLAVALDPALELLRQRIDHRHADAVQAAGDFVVLVVEFSAGVQAREDQLDAAHLLFRMDVHRHAAAIVRHGQGVVLVQRDVDFLGVAGERFVDRVVDDFVREVIRAARCRCTCPGGGARARDRRGLRCRMRCRTFSAAAETETRGLSEPRGAESTSDWRAARAAQASRSAEFGAQSPARAA